MCVLKQQPQQEHSFDAKDYQPKEWNENLVQPLLHVWAITNPIHTSPNQAQLCCGSTSCCNGRVRLGPTYSMQAAQPRRAAGGGASLRRAERWSDSTALCAPKKDTCARAGSLMKSPLSTSGSKISSPYTLWWHSILLWFGGALLSPVK